MSVEDKITSLLTDPYSKLKTHKRLPYYCFSFIYRL